MRNFIQWQIELRSRKLCNAKNVLKTMYTSYLPKLHTTRQLGNFKKAKKEAWLIVGVPEVATAKLKNS